MPNDVRLCYPQITFPVAEETRNTPQYRLWLTRNLVSDACRARGWLPRVMRDEGVLVAGRDARVLVLADREDFSRCVSALCRQCRPLTLPPTIGAMTVFGVRNALKIDQWREDLSEAEREAWPETLKRGLAERKALLTDDVILLTEGEYSHVPAADTPYAPDEWRLISLTIRMYHELSHVYARSVFPQNKEAVRDEVIADAIGLVAATGRYDAALAARLIGVSEDRVLEDGRIHFYLSDEPPDALLARVRWMISDIARAWERAGNIEPMGFLHRLEEEKIGI